MSPEINVYNVDNQIFTLGQLTSGSPLLGHCVVCLTNTDCNTAPKLPICGNQGSCRPCYNDSECATGKKCNYPSLHFSTTGERNAQSLNYGGCISCFKDTDCPQDNPICGADGACGPCTSDSQCLSLPMMKKCIPSSSITFRPTR